MKRRVIRSWPWTIALAAVLGGLLVVGLFRLSTAGGVGDLVFGGLLVAGALYALYRVLTSGVHILPSGLIIRELTRSTPIPWSQVRAVDCAKSAGRGYVPVLTLTGPPPGKPRPGTGTGPGKNGQQQLEVTVLAAYREPVARRRADQLAAAFAATRGRTRRR